MPASTCCRASLIHVGLRCQRCSLQALRLEPYLVISNQTGIPLQLMQPRRGAVQQSFAGVAPSQATRDGLPRAGVPPAGRQSFGHGPPPQGLRSAISAQDADHTSTLDLPTGAQSTASLELSFNSGLAKTCVTWLHAGVCSSHVMKAMGTTSTASFDCCKDSFRRCHCSGQLL